jgi:hypothetical protein
MRLVSQREQRRSRPCLTRLQEAECCTLPLPLRPSPLLPAVRLARQARAEKHRSRYRKIDELDEMCTAQVMQLQGTCLFSKQGGQARKGHSKSGRVGGLALSRLEMPLLHRTGNETRLELPPASTCCLHRFKAPSKMGRVSTTQHQRSAFSGRPVALGVRGFPGATRGSCPVWPGGLGLAGWRCTWVRSLCRSCRARAHRRLKWHVPSSKWQPGAGGAWGERVPGGALFVRPLPGVWFRAMPFWKQARIPHRPCLQVVPSWCCAGPLVRQLLVVPLQSRPRRNMRRGCPLFCHSCRDADKSRGPAGGGSTWRRHGPTGEASEVRCN